MTSSSDSFVTSFFAHVDEHVPQYVAELSEAGKMVRADSLSLA